MNAIVSYVEAQKKGNIKTPKLVVGKMKTWALVLCKGRRAMHHRQRSWQVQWNVPVLSTCINVPVLSKHIK